MPEMFFGGLDVGAAAALRDVRKEFPSGKGWAGLYLEEAGGDHRAAILKFLERCAEYDALTRERAT